MRRSSMFLVAMAAVVAIFAGRLAAVVVERPVTPASLKEPDNRFDVKVEKGDDGLIHFTITYRLSEARYLVAHTEVRDRDSVVMKTDVPQFVREATATFYAAVDPSHLSGARFELAERSFNMAMDGRPIPMPGGIDYELRLSDFAAIADAKHEAK